MNKALVLGFVLVLGSWGAGCGGSNSAPTKKYPQTNPGDPLASGDSNHVGDPNHAGDTHHGGDTNPAGDPNHAGDTHRGGDAYHGGDPYHPGDTIHGGDPAHGGDPLAGWTCDPGFFSDTTCDCGCGIPDPVCTNGCVTPGCTASGCDYCYDASGSYVPCAAPPGWTCDPINYDDYSCDCGCTVHDIDCYMGGGCTTPGCTPTDSACDHCWGGSFTGTCPP